MRRVIRAVLICLVLMAITWQVIAAIPVSAQGNAPVWPVGTYLAINPDVPFVWLRATASSTGAVRLTIYPGSRWDIQVANSHPHWDGVQWWWYLKVTTNTMRNFSGWVEQKSLILARYPGGLASPTPTPKPVMGNTPPPNWLSGALLQLKASVPFAWLRWEPNSNAFIVGYFSEGQFSKLQWDGVQWWAYVTTAGHVPFYGWVEVNSLELAATHFTSKAA